MWQLSLLKESERGMGRENQGPPRKRRRIDRKGLAQLKEVSVRKKALFMTSRTLMTMLGVGPSFIDRLVERKRIPYYRINGELMFKISEVEEWIASCKYEQREPHNLRIINGYLIAEGELDEEGREGHSSDEDRGINKGGV